jgi:hypothetical protein
MRWGVAGGEDCAAVYWEAMHEVVAGGGESALAVKAADATVHQTAADGNLSPFPLSHQKGALQSSC